MKKGIVVRISIFCLLLGFVFGVGTVLVVENPKEYIVQLRPYHDEAKPTELSVDIDILDKDRRTQFFNGTFHWRQKDQPFTIVGREGLFYRGYEQFGFELAGFSAASYTEPRFEVE